MAEAEAPVVRGQAGGVWVAKRLEASATTAVDVVIIEPDGRRISAAVWPRGREACARLAGLGRYELDRVREIVLGLPGVSERVSHGAPSFFVQDRRALCRYHDNHGGDGRIALWCPVPAGVQEHLVSAEPERFFAPRASASGTFSRWLGVYLDTAGENRVDWDEIAAFVEDAFRTVAPRRLIAELDRR